MIDESFWRLEFDDSFVEKSAGTKAGIKDRVKMKIWWFMGRSARLTMKWKLNMFFYAWWKKVEKSICHNMSIEFNRYIYIYAFWSWYATLCWLHQGVGSNGLFYFHEPNTKYIWTNRWDWSMLVVRHSCFSGLVFHIRAFLGECMFEKTETWKYKLIVCFSMFLLEGRSSWSSPQ